VELEGNWWTPSDDQLSGSLPVTAIYGAEDKKSKLRMVGDSE
jgi:hypothetical protein